jgi:hypothetical protein
MKDEAKRRIQLIIVMVVNSIILTGILFATDVLYAGIQEYLFKNNDPSYIADFSTANKAIIGGTLTIVLGLVIYGILLWSQNREQVIEDHLKDREIIQTTNILNFNAVQEEIGYSIESLKSTFGYIITIILLVSSFNFIRFTWLITKYHQYDQFVIRYILKDAPTIIVSINLFLLISIVTTYVLFTTLRKYNQFKLISSHYNEAMLQVRENFYKLLKKENEEEKEQPEQSSTKTKDSTKSES